MRRQLEPMGIDPIIIHGDDRESMFGLPRDYDSGLADAHLGRQMGDGEVGALLGHLRAYQALINSGEEWGHILEDDCVLECHPIPHFDRIIKLEPDARMVFGHDAKSYDPARPPIQRDGYLELDSVPYGAFNYAIHRKLAAQAIVHLRGSLHMPGDVYFVKWVLQNPAAKTYFQVPISHERPTGSSVIGDDARMWDFPPSAWRKLESNHLCPLLTHQIWLGPGCPQDMIDSWIQHNPDRIHTLWGYDKCLAICEDYGVARAFRSYLQPGLYPGAADVARYCILSRFGGFYADADSRALRPMDIRQPFLVKESEVHRPGLLCNGFIQCMANDPLMLDLVKQISIKEHPVDRGIIHRELGPSLLTETQKGYKIQHLPSGLFLPHHYLGRNTPAGAPYCEHAWDSTHSPV